MSEYQNFLAHHGIKGQKWGVRRYQNDDGTLTPEGRARYLEETERAYNENRRINQTAKQHLKSINEYNKRASKEINIDDYDKVSKYLYNKINKKVSEAGDDDQKRIDASSKAMVYEKKMKEFVKSKETVTIKEIHDYSNALGKEMNANMARLNSSEDNKLRNVTERSVIGYDGKLLPWEKRNADKVQRRVDRVTNKYLKKNQKNDPDGEKFMKAYEDSKKTDNLTNRFHKALKDDPSLTYDRIYKEMKVNLDSDDPDDYKNAEDRWLRKHGY